MRTGAEHDVVVAGDGPAAAAVVDACRRQGLDVVAVGPTSSWPNTYGMWRDEAPDLPDACFRSITAHSIVRARTERLLDRPYGVLDNAAVRTHLGLDEVRHHGRVDRLVDAGDLAIAHLDDGELLAGRWAVDATGRSGADAWQTAYGVVVAAADLERAGCSTEDATVMAWLAGTSPPSFLHAVPVAHGWLVEVTSLAARPAVDPQRLRRTLVELVGEAPVVAAEALGRTEVVWIPMGGARLPDPGSRIVPFGTAGGMGHPATGFSVAASLSLADRFAAAVAAGDDPVDAVWTPSLRRTRELHEAGLGALLKLDGDGLIDFFEAFFAVPVDLAADFLRVDADDERVGAAMRAVFREAPWSVRRRLLGLDPRLLARIARSAR